ncbi:MAG: hypothetical protein K8S87_03085 [Planctomycetes bacterium]|nr:hypothetical protein [Planctomycetota bacterium]
MKKFLIMIFVVAVVVLIVPKTALAQATFVPPFDNNRTSSLHFGFGELLYDIDYDSGLLSDVDVSQTVAIFGGNWEHSVSYGFYHCRFGVMGLGDTENTTSSSTTTSTFWKDNQNLSIYFGGGYIFLSEVPLTALATFPGPNTNNHPQGTMAFFGGGFDFNVYGQWETHTSGITDYETGFYVSDLSLVALGGIRIPNVGFVLHASFSFHFRLGWEMRQSRTTGGLETVINLSESAELGIPFGGMELGIAYEVSSLPRLRFGIVGKFVNSMMLIFHGGYVF